MSALIEDLLSRSFPKETLKRGSRRIGTFRASFGGQYAVELSVVK
jgi:hypothetical protein